MKYVLLRLLIVVLAILGGVAGTIFYAFFPETLLGVVLVLFIFASVLAWQYHEIVDKQIQEKWEKRFPSNPDVVEEDKK